MRKGHGKSFYKCSILVKIKPPAHRGLPSGLEAYGLEAPRRERRKFQPPQRNRLRIPRGRQEYVRYFEDLNLSLTPTCPVTSGGLAR